MSGIAFIGDLQAEYENLDLCQKVIEQVRDYTLEHQTDAVVFLGDIKEKYNPIDVRVLNFALWAVDQFISHKIPVLVLLGNHDRVGLYADTENWLPALAKAGARVFDTPGIVSLERFRLFMLPYMHSTEKLKRSAGVLAYKASTMPSKDSKANVLCFHAGLAEASYTDFYKSQDKFSVDELMPQCYRYVIGGHIHLHQTVKYPHVMYAGSLFATDWGEANQEKGFLYLGD